MGPDSKEPELEPGRRDYTWTVDSVYSAPGGWMNTIWGSSPNDVWIGSVGGYDKLWHFDGTKWTSWPYREGSNGFVGDFYSIYGFAQDNVWMGSNEGKIFHFDGQEWKLFQTYKKEGYYISSIRDIWGDSVSEIYAVGIAIENESPEEYRSFLLYYDGSEWVESVTTDFWMQFQRVRKKDDIYIYGFGLLSGQPNLYDVSYYKYKKNKLIEIYSKRESEAKFPNVNEFGDKVYFVIENDVTNTEFKSILPFSITEDVYGVNGRHEHDMFITTEYGVLHYNGEDTEDLFRLEHKNAIVFRSLILENDVFFLVNDYEAGTNLIYHGILPKEQRE